MKTITMAVFFLNLVLYSNYLFAVPTVTGDPVIVQHLGKIIWPQNTPLETPYLTQLNSSDINDLHGDLNCEFIISTAGNYHFALLQAMQGRSDMGFEGWQTILKRDYNLNACWSTSPPIAIDQVATEKLQIKNIIMHGKPALVMGPPGDMTTLTGQGAISSSTAFVRNKGNSLLIRADKKNKIKNVCDMGRQGIRVVTPSNTLENGSFTNFSNTIFNVAEQNPYGCDATELFNSIFSQNLSSIDQTAFDNPTDIDGVMSVFGHGKHVEGKGPRWIASSRIMHRDIPYALCYDQADAAVIFHHQATYLKTLMAQTMNCQLDIVTLPGTVDAPRGNQFATIRIAKILGHTEPSVISAQDALFDFFVNSPVWTRILQDNDLVDPSPN